MTARASSETEVSAREVEVLAAVSEHLTNAEIAARLFISVRTVESHVSSLLRKLQVADRRELTRAAAGILAAPAVTGLVRRPAGSLPSPLTSFVGRETETAALARALRDNRLVTAVGPGGVGKTRLALHVADEVRGDYADGAWFVDLVPVTQPTSVPASVAATLGLGESQGHSLEDLLTGWLSERNTLLILDNCEHLLEAVGVLLERLLTACPDLTVLATSRSRLLLPFESAYPVPGLSVETSDGRLADAVSLFLSRVAAGGAKVDAGDLARIAALCRGLDGMALAIELAAARLPSLGLDGLEVGLADRLEILTGGSRVDDRHRSLRSALDWSYALLSEVERALLRRVSVYAAPFSAQAVAEMLAGWAPIGADQVPTLLARLAEQSLLVPVSTPIGTRYRALESIRQYGAGLAEFAGESDEARARHLAWCLAAAERLGPPVFDGGTGDVWRAEFDEISIEARGILPWARHLPGQRELAYRLALLLAGLSFLRGRPSESQRRYELAAELAPDGAAEAAALRQAAGAAEGRHFGNEALRLRQLAAEVALRAGDRTGAAMDLARAAELIGRGPGIIAVPPESGEVQRMLAAARPLATGSLSAEARILTAEAFAAVERDPIARSLVDRALELARRAGDRLGESAALDMITSVQLANGQHRAALDSAIRRTELLAPLPVTAESALEFFDAYQMASQCAVAAGQLSEARRLGEGLSELPFYREEHHLATSRLIVVGLFSGDWQTALEQSEMFRAGWERAGRPAAGNLRTAPYAAATIHALRGDESARADWMAIVAMLDIPGRPLPVLHFGELFDGMVLLHRGRAADAVVLLADRPESFVNHYNGMWQAWYASAWAEAAVLARLPDAVQRVRVARLYTGDNPVASAIVERASGLAAMLRPAGAAGRDEIMAAASALRSLGARYQWARTLVMLGGDYQEEGTAELTSMGASPMAWPPG